MGKLNQYTPERPYEGFVQAIAGWVKRILTQPPAVVERWRERLTDALESNGALVLEVIPELALIVGQQPEVEALPPDESLNRFTQVFTKLLCAFFFADSPPVLILDDLQWADAASLELMQRLACSPETGSMLLLGTYRRNEVDGNHPLTTAVDAIKDRGGDVHETAL